MKPFFFGWVTPIPAPLGRFPLWWCIRQGTQGHGFAGDGFLAVPEPEEGLERSDLAGESVRRNPFDRRSMVEASVRIAAGPSAGWWR